MPTKQRKRHFTKESSLAQFSNDELFTELINRIQKECRNNRIDDQTYCMFVQKEGYGYISGRRLYTVQPNITWATTYKEEE